METFSALLAICAGNSPVPGEFTAQSPVTRSFDVFFDRRLNKRLSKQSWSWWFETQSRPLWRHRNDTILALQFNCRFCKYAKPGLGNQAASDIPRISRRNNVEFSFKFGQLMCFDSSSLMKRHDSILPVEIWQNIAAVLELSWISGYLVVSPAKIIISHVTCICAGNRCSDGIY